MKSLSLNFRPFIILAALIFSISACETAEEPMPQGFSEEITRLIPDSTISAMRDLQMIINEGMEPPTLEGVYFASPLVITKSNVPNEIHGEGSRFADYRYYMRNQNIDDLTMELDSEGLSINSGSVITRSIGKQAFISGNRNSFTAFIIQDSEMYLESGDTARSRVLEVISGTLSADGIKNFQNAVWMLNDYGDEFNLFIPANTGRIFNDGDLMAQRISCAYIEVVHKSSGSELPQMLEYSAN